jgi:uncharacterized peroxidase-related enzyme
MSRLPVIENEAAGNKARRMLEGVHAKLKMTPNFLRVMANSPAVLEGYLGFSGALAGGLLPAALREELALSIGEQNGCQYCVSAHAAIGSMVGLTGAEIEKARETRSDFPQYAEALRFAREVLAHRGRVTDADFEALRKVGFGEGEIAEILAHVALNVFTNYFNTATEVEVDFPRVALRPAA